jgi:hypothetical protein
MDVIETELQQRPVCKNAQSGNLIRPVVEISWIKQSPAMSIFSPCIKATLGFELLETSHVSPLSAACFNPSFAFWGYLADVIPAEYFSGARILGIVDDRGWLTQNFSQLLAVRVSPV